MGEQPRARVFVSCGQRTGGERQAAAAIEQVLTDLGFDVYVATMTSTSQALLQGIFEKLESSEYFLFVDFAREYLQAAPTPECERVFEPPAPRRGSLFSHQELAVASYLGIEAIGFQEAPLSYLDGMMQAIGLNPASFSSPLELPELVYKQVAGRWHTGWRRALALSLAPQAVRIAIRDRSEGLSGLEGLFYHLEIANLHRRSAARNCTAYLVSARGPLASPASTEGPEHVRETAELKWAGTSVPQVMIMPGTSRKLDAMHVVIQQPGTIYFNQLVDSGQFLCRLTEPGDYRLTYAVFSDNLAAAEASFVVHHAGDSASLQISRPASSTRARLPQSTDADNAQLLEYLDLRDESTSGSSMHTSISIPRPTVGTPDSAPESAI
ncbi:MAG: hypothetical protein ACYC5O_17985 [Anaerolineae bacterium]